MFIDFKLTVWERIHINDAAEAVKVRKALTEGVINDSNWLWSNVNNPDDLRVETLMETSAMMPLSMNGWRSTIEAFEADGEEIWNNGIVTDD